MAQPVFPPFFALLHAYRLIPINCTPLAPSWLVSVNLVQNTWDRKARRKGLGHFFPIPLHRLWALFITEQAYILTSVRNSLLHCPILYRIQKMLSLSLDPPDLGWGLLTTSNYQLSVDTPTVSFKPVRTSANRPFIVFYWTIWVRFYFLPES